MANQHPTKIRSLLKNVAAAPYKIAPEREDDLQDIVEGKGVRFEVDCKGEGFDFCSSWMIHRIFSNIRSLEFLWANAYFNLIFYDAYVTQPLGSSIQIEGHSQRTAAQSLLLWSEKALKSREPILWPDDLPSPETPEGIDEYIERANHLFLSMCGFILLHELAHIVHEHRVDQNTPQEVKHEYEFEAGKWAYDWILEDWERHDSDPMSFATRSLGVGSGLASLAFLELNLPDAVEREHPTLPKRLIRLCEDHFREPVGAEATGAALAMIPLVLHSHIQRKKLPIDVKQSYRSTVDYLNSIDEHFDA